MALNMAQSTSINTLPVRMDTPSDVRGGALNKAAAFNRAASVAGVAFATWQCVKSPFVDVAHSIVELPDV